MTHDLSVIIPDDMLSCPFLPVVRMVSKYLEFGVGDTPVLVRCAFLEDLLVLNNVVDFVLAARG